MAPRGLTWTDEEVVALFGRVVVCSCLGGTAGGLQGWPHLPQDHDRTSCSRVPAYCQAVQRQTESAKKKYNEVINRHRQSGAGVESDKEVTQGDFWFFSQIHHVLGGRAVVNPPHLVEIRSRSQSPASSESATPLMQKFTLKISVIPAWHNVLIERCTPRLRPDSSFQPIPLK